MCNKCERRWKSLTQAHCAACCRHFSTIEVFDAHQLLRDEEVVCREPGKNRYVYDEERALWAQGFVTQMPLFARGVEKSGTFTPRVSSAIAWTPSGS